VGQATIKRDGVFAQVVDKIVDDHGEPEIKRQLLGADVRLTQGLARLLLKKPAAERKAAVEELLEKGELPRAKKGSAPAPKAKEVAQSLVARLDKMREGHARAVVIHMARLLGLELTDKS
jgi:hypothetical protein